MILSHFLLVSLVAGGDTVNALRRREMASVIPFFELTNKEELLQTVLTGSLSSPAKDLGYDEFFVGELRFAFFRGTNYLAYGIGNPYLNASPTQTLSDEAFKIRALGATHALTSFPRENPKLTVTHSNPGESPATVSVDVTMMIGQRTCDNGALLEYDARSGRLLSFRADRPLDHSRYRNSSLVGEAQALVAAIDAYSRWKPFANGLVTYGPLLRSGVQNPGSGGDCAVEVTPSVTQEWRASIARPYWLVQFANAPGGGLHQRVCVDAITGKAQVIDSFIALRANALAVSPLHASETLQTSTGKGEVKRTANVDRTGKEVVVRRGKHLLTATFDSKRKLLFLPSEGRWVTYKVGVPFAKSIDKAIAQLDRRGTFGAKGSER